MAFTDVMLLWGHEADGAGWAPKQGTRRAEWGVVRWTQWCGAAVGMRGAMNCPWMELGRQKGWGPVWGAHRSCLTKTAMSVMMEPVSPTAGDPGPGRGDARVGVGEERSVGPT